MEERNVSYNRRRLCFIIGLHIHEERFCQYGRVGGKTNIYIS